MTNIINFPDSGLYRCGDCGKAISSDEGEVCPVNDCAVIGCYHCAEFSLYCLDHMEFDPNASARGRSNQRGSP